MMTDPIADMLTRIRNAVNVERLYVEMPSSKVKRGLADVLKREGYIWDWQEVEDEPVAQLRLELKYGAWPTCSTREGYIWESAASASRGRSVYSQGQGLRVPELNVLGITIIGTSQGDRQRIREARQQARGPAEVLQ